MIGDNTYIYLTLGYIISIIVSLFFLIKEQTDSVDLGVDFTIKDLLFCIIISIIPVANVLAVCMFVCTYIMHSPRVVRAWKIITWPRLALGNMISSVMQRPIIEGKKDDQI